MESLRELYRIGNGPSSSHSVGPRLAMAGFVTNLPIDTLIQVTLYGSLAATGRGHRTQDALVAGAGGRTVTVLWRPDISLPHHPNGMAFQAISANGQILDSWAGYSIGGGAIRNQGEDLGPRQSIYPHDTATEILAWCQSKQARWSDYILAHEDRAFPDFLQTMATAMQSSIDAGLTSTGALHGGLGLAGSDLSRRAATLWQSPNPTWPEHRLAAYALAVSEENAAGNLVVTAPTCGGAGVVPAVLRYVAYDLAPTVIDNAEKQLRFVNGLATAGLFGALIKTNASISGAAVGCQGEVGAACAMAAAAAAEILGGNPAQVEAAAEIGLEHHLGLTCDPVGGMVQIPCIERNAVAALRALDAARLALAGDGQHRVSFDNVVEAMRQTGADLKDLYRETSRGGLAAVLGLTGNPCA